MRSVLLALLIYCVFTLTLTYPLVLQVGEVFPHDYGDPALNTWIIWWNAHAVPYSTTWWNAPAFYPVEGVLTFSENLLGLTPITSPIQWLGGTPLLAHNIAFLATFPLCAVGAYLVVLEIARRHDAAFIGGLFFGFAPYRMAHLPHVQVLAAFAMAFGLAALHRYRRDSRRPWLVLFGVAWLVQALCNGYYLFFFTALVAMWTLWFAPSSSRRRFFGAVAFTGCIAAVPLVPLLWHYKQVHDRLGFVRDFGTMRHYGADVLALLNAERALTVWGWLRLYDRAEGQLFPGLAITLIIIVGALLIPRTQMASNAVATSSRWLRVARQAMAAVLAVSLAVTFVALAREPLRISLFGLQLSAENPIKPLTWAFGFGLLLLLTSAGIRRAYATRSVVGFYALAAFVMWLFSLGPAPTLMGEPLLYRGPYTLLMGLPGFSSLRVPARFWMMSVLCLAIVGGLVFDRIGARFPRRRWLIAVSIVLIALADAWTTSFPLAPVPSVWQTRHCIPPARGHETGAVMELPLGDIVADVGAMYRSISHGHPTVNGYSGYFPPQYVALKEGLEARDPDVLTQLTGDGLVYVMIDRGYGAAPQMSAYVAAQPGAELLCSPESHVVFRLRPHQGNPR